MIKKSNELQVGDAVKLGPYFSGGGYFPIIKFKPYTGPIDFVERIAVFRGAGGMSIEKGSVWQVWDESCNEPVRFANRLGAEQ